MLELRVTCRVYTCIIYSVIYTHGSLQAVIYSNGRGVSSRTYRHINSKALVWRIALSSYYLCRQFGPKSTVLVIPLASVLLYLCRQFGPKSTVLVIPLASVLLYLCRQFRPKSTVLVIPLASVLLWLCGQFRPMSTVLFNPLSLSFFHSIFMTIQTHVDCSNSINCFSSVRYFILSRLTVGYANLY